MVSVSCFNSPRIDETGTITVATGSGIIRASPSTDRRSWANSMRTTPLATPTDRMPPTIEDVEHDVGATRAAGERLQATDVVGVEVTDVDVGNIQGAETLGRHAAACVATAID